MCDFHSTIWRQLGQEVQMFHKPSNSHSQMVADSGWRDNEPNRKTLVFEAEWDGRGEMPSRGRLIRNSGECPESVVKKVQQHYRKLADAIKDGKHLDYFLSDSKWSDVWARLKTLPEGVTFPAKCDYLDLRSLTTLPEGVTFPAKCDYLDLRSDLKAKIKK